MLNLIARAIEFLDAHNVNCEMEMMLILAGIVTALSVTGIAIVAHDAICGRGGNGR